MINNFGMPTSFLRTSDLDTLKSFHEGYSYWIIKELQRHYTDVRKIAIDSVAANVKIQACIIGKRHVSFIPVRVFTVFTKQLYEKLFEKVKSERSNSNCVEKHWYMSFAFTDPEPVCR